MNALGMVETNNIAKGFEVCDAMLKAARVRLISSNPVCPGKYIILVKGRVAAVRSSVQAGELIARDCLVDSFVIADVHPDVFPAISGTVSVEEIRAIGSIETFSLASAVVAGDEAAKAADIILLEIRLGMALAGKAFVIFTGDVAAVEAAVKAGVSRAEGQGLILGSVVIPSPHPDLIASLLS